MPMPVSCTSSRTKISPLYSSSLLALSETLPLLVNFNGITGVIQQCLLQARRISFSQRGTPFCSTSMVNPPLLSAVCFSIDWTPFRLSPD